MVNKKLKKKTKWHPLSLAGQDDNLKMVDSNKSGVPSKIEWKVSNDTCENASNHYQNKDNTTIPSTNETKNNHHSYYRFDKRASYKSYSKLHHLNGYSLNSMGGDRFGKQDFNKNKDLPKKVQFNEDEYTRITTPRQDVLFKKGYLSRPKTQNVTQTHEAYNNGTLDEYYQSYITADSPPLTINRGLASANGTEYSFIPATPGAFLNDALNNFYGNTVYYMSYPDMFYPPTTPTTNIDMQMGDQYNKLYINDLYSSPLIEENHESISHPVTSSTNTNWSDSSDSSEEISLTTVAPESVVKTQRKIVHDESEIEKKVDTQSVDEQSVEIFTNDENFQREVQQTVVSPVYDNGYESISPYLNPYAPVFYYPLPYYSVPAMEPYSSTEYYHRPDFESLSVYQNGFQFENGRHGKHPKRKKRYRKTRSSSGTSITDYSEDESNHLDVATTSSGDSGFLDAKKVENSSNNHPVPSYTPESIIEDLTHQSTLNVEVPEFRPKVVLQSSRNGFTNCINNIKTKITESQESLNNKNIKPSNTISTNSKPLIDKKLQERKVRNENVEHTKMSNIDNKDRNNVNVKKRTVKNAVLDKKFLIESAKNIEMQNIDLNKINNNVLPRNDNLKIKTTWTVVGGNRKIIDEDIEFESETSENELKDIQQTFEYTSSTKISPKIETITVKDEISTSSYLQTKKPNRKSKQQKNKHLNKRNGLRVKNQKLIGFIVEEPTFNHINSLAADEQESCEDENEDFNPIDEIQKSDIEIFNEEILIEEIPCIAEDIEAFENVIEIKNQLTPGLSNLSSNLSPTCVNIDETEQTDFCLENYDKTVLLQETEPKAEISCSKIFHKTQCNCLYQTKIIGVKDHVESENSKAICKSIHLNKVFNEIKTKNDKKSNEMIVFDCKDELMRLETKSKTCSPSDFADISNEISEKYYVTAAVCNWLHTFNTNDLQSLFTIPLSTDFVEKIKYCSEISQFFADDELHNLNNFIDENFCKYQQLSSCSSLSSLISDTDNSDENNIESNSKLSLPINNKNKNTNTTQNIKLFGCEIM